MTAHRSNLNILIVVLLAAVIFMGLGLAYLAKQPPTLSSPNEMSPVGGNYPNTRIRAWESVDLQVEDLSVAQREQLNKKVLEPALDYYAKDVSLGVLVSLTISANTDDMAIQFPYRGTLGFDSGEQLEFVVEQSGTEILWWQPTCEVCTFDEEYRALYPEIVSLYP